MTLTKWAVIVLKGLVSSPTVQGAPYIGTGDRSFENGAPFDIVS